MAKKYFAKGEDGASVKIGDVDHAVGAEVTFETEEAAQAAVDAGQVEVKEVEEGGDSAAQA